MLTRHVDTLIIPQFYGQSVKVVQRLNVQFWYVVKGFEEFVLKCMIFKVLSENAHV